ncbi:MAG: glutamine--fructose-6-phosphate transaminase (isomerizing) [Candidatus Cloacimonetes bacterium 4572_65]|nr:MAG: glutamine--fructose-6-phosphate transaminase (isomerizing) [Candidatus Cloacimonetes bacterium 4572_65]
MCGIVGYLGKKNAVPIVLQALKKLEYRGYDSSGIAIIHNNSLNVYKEKGKIVELERSLPAPDITSSNVAIAHTRWATHGEPSKLNAHPHTDKYGKIALVHNGIIENYTKLKENLKEYGDFVDGETDTEILAHVVGHFYNESKSLEEALVSTLKIVEGTYGIALLCEDNPGQLLAARKGSPLILGVGSDAYYLTSDVNAILSHTNRVVYLNDGEIVNINEDGYEIKTLDNTKISPTISVVEWEATSVEKNNYKHFMLKEIFEQPITVKNAFRGRLAENMSTARLNGLNMTGSELRKVKRLQLIACGTSYYSCLLGKNLIERMARIPVEIQYASEYRYRNPIIEDDTLVFVLSQSGETADTLAAMREAQAKGARVMGITNGIGSTIARESDGGVYIYAGAEIGVASTKAFTSQVTVLYLLSLLLGRMKGISPVNGMKYINALKELPSQIEEILEMSDEIREIAKKIIDSDNALYLGRDLHLPVALEGALKLKEISYIHAEGYPAAEMKHGPIALIDENMPVIAIAPHDILFDKIISNLQEVVARKGRLFTIVTEVNSNLQEISEDMLLIPKTLPELQPILSVIPLQLLAYHVADLRELDVDQPRNLAKSVTVE